jgi:aspartate 1-decarboxylase
MRQFLRAKIHGAVITEALLDYEGSLGVDEDYLDATGIAPFEAVEIYNVTNGMRVKTYAIPLERGSRRFESNGAAAHLIRKGDRVIVVCYQYFTAEKLLKFKGPEIMILDQQNSIKKLYRPELHSSSPSMARKKVMPKKKKKR